MSHKGKRYNVIYSHSKYTDLTAVGVFDWGKTIEGISRARTVSKWIAVIIMIFAAGATVIFSASITRPISTLSKLMKKAQTGDMTVRFENHYKGEIGQLGDSFNAMVEKLMNFLALYTKNRKIKEKQSLRFFMSRLSRTFFIIHLIRYSGWQSSTMRRILLIWCLLCQDFPYQSESGKRIYYIGTGSLMVKNYLDIQKVRYEDLFEYKTEIEEGLGNYMVLKICLQPLVENALYHGIKESDQDRGTIWIRAFQSQRIRSYLR